MNQETIINDKNGNPIPVEDCFQGDSLKFSTFPLNQPLWIPSQKRNSWRAFFPSSRNGKPSNWIFSPKTERISSKLYPPLTSLNFKNFGSAIMKLSPSNVSVESIFLEILDLGICPVIEDSIKFVVLRTFGNADGQGWQSTACAITLWLMETGWWKCYWAISRSLSPSFRNTNQEVPAGS